MKSQTIPSILLALGFAALAAFLNWFAAPSAFAASLTWDTTIVADATITAGSGTWLNGSGNWNNGTTSIGINWNNANPDFAKFAGADGTYAITVGGPITTAGGAVGSLAGGLVFANSGYTLSASSAQIITGGGGTTNCYVNVSSGKTATIGSNVTLAKGGSGGNLMLLGGGTLQITAGGVVTNTSNVAIEVAEASTLWINGGTVSLGGSISLGKLLGTNPEGASGNLIVDFGALLIGGTGNFAIGRTSGDNCTATLNGGSITAAGGNLNYGLVVNSGNGTVNLNGGTLTVKAITEAEPLVNSTFNFNGGTLKAAAASATFMTGLNTAQIRNTAANIDPNGFAITISQPLLHSTIGGDNAADGGLVVANSTGSGTLTLSGANSFNGPTKITAGTLSLANSLALSNSPLDTLNSVTGNAANGFKTTVTALTLGGLTGNKNLASIFTTTSGGYSGVTALTLNPVNGATPSYSGNIANGAGGMTLTKSGYGTQTLTGANTYSGATVISGGTLALSGIGTLATPSISIGSGASFDVSAQTTPTLAANQNLLGTGSVKGNLTTVATTTIYPGTSGAAGTLTFSNNLTLSAGGSLAFDLSNNPNTVGGGVNDLLQVNGALALNGTNSVVLNALNTSLVNGVYTLISCSSVTGGDASYFQVAGALSGTRRQLDVSNSVVGVQLVVSGADPTNLVWAGDGAANVWNVNGPANWNGGAEKFYNLDSVVFDDTGSASPSVNLVGALLPSAVTVNNSNQDYTFAGSGSISGGAGLNKSGSRSLTLAGTNQFTGAVLNTAGTLFVNGSLTAASTVTNYSGATIGGSGLIAGTLNLAAGSIVTNRVGSPLTVGTLNLAGNAVMNVSTPSVLGHGDYVLMNFSALQGGGQFTTVNVSGAGVVPGATSLVVITTNGLVNLHVAATNPPARPSPFVVVNSDYKIASQSLANFNSAGADKLVVTVCCEANGPILTGVTFGGVAMTPAIYKLHAAGIQHAAIYYLDRPSGTGNIVASWSAGVGGAGIGAIALKGATDGVAFTAFDNNSRSLTLTNLLNDAFVVAASVGDGTAAYANPPLTQLVGGWDTGGSDGSAGYFALKTDGPFTASFMGSNVRPVTVAAVFGTELRKAYAFSPADGAVAIATNVTLTWTEGIYGSPTNDNAVYFGTDYAAVLAAEVNDATGIFKGRQSTNRYSPGMLQAGATYYWRIDQHNDAIPSGPRRGPVLSFTVGLPKYVFSGSMSSNSTVAYLARAINQTEFCQPFSLAAFNEDKRMLRNIGAKFIARAALTWDVPGSLTNSLIADYEGFFEKIKGYGDRMLAEDAEMILQGTLFEIVQSATNASGVLVRAGVDQVPVPAWVLQAFGQPVVARNFNYNNMLYSFDLFGQYNNRWGDRSSVPDITKLETRMYFYYRACRFIDVGFESLHLGQIDLMDNNDGSSRTNTIDLFNKIRAYAALHARRGFILLDSDAPYGNIAVSGNLLFDIGSFPLRPREVCSTPTNNGVYDAILEKNYIDSLYGRTVGGTTPSGWYCAHVPYNVSFDNSGALANAPVCGAGTAIWPWGWEESSWFAHNSNAYRNYWLGYAMNWLKTNDNIGYLRPSGRISISGAPMDINGDGLLDWEYRANTPSSACPTGFGQEETIKSLWAEPIVLSPLQQWRLTNFGTTNTTGLAANDADWDGDGLKNIFEYAFNTNPTNANTSPMTYSIVSDHLRVVIPRTHPAPPDITYIYEVSTNLASGVWNNGPAWATESVTDNLNGTETLTVTVTPSVSTTSPVFFRLRISQP